ncbi:MAG: DUF2357 domain-containing protein [Kiritimatiellae bacterium]|nr:DUF2357 domain-containing protein [Kiritimatiellia bacterium]
MKQKKVFAFEIPGLLSFCVTGNNTGRVERYCKRIKCTSQDDKAKVLFQANRKGTWHFFEPKSETVEENVTASALPVFYETTYQVKCKFERKVKDVRVSHKLVSVADEFYYDEEDCCLSGPLNFINTPGKFAFEINIEMATGETTTLKLEWWVVSEKMNVIEDYSAIVEKVSSVKPELVYAFLAKTMNESGLSSEKGQSDAVWYDIFQTLVSTYRSACEHVVHNPHLRYVEHEQYLRVNQIRRWTPALMQRYQQTDKSVREMRHFHATEVVPEVDTVENRFVLFTLTKIAERLRDFAKRCREEGGGKISEDFIKQMEVDATSFEEMTYHPFFREVGHYNGVVQESLALLRKRGYAEIYDTWLKLKHSLDLTGSGIDVGNNPIWKLYEFWCFLMIRDWLMERYPDPKGSLGDVVETSDIFEDPYDEATGETKQPAGSKKCEYVFKDEMGNREIVLTYQLSYGHGKNGSEDVSGHLSYVVEQIPDIVMTIKDLGIAQNEHTYLFDAKYRIMQYPSATDHQKDASPHAAINDMHRYRDAILYRSQKSGKLSREVIGAYVLFPGRLGESYDYTEIIRNENIGAIPLLPGEEGTKALLAFLEEIITRGTPKEHLEKVIPTRGTSAVLGDDMPLGFPKGENIIRISSTEKRPYYEYFNELRGSTIPTFFYLTQLACEYDGNTSEQNASQKQMVIIWAETDKRLPIRVLLGKYHGCQKYDKESIYRLDNNFSGGNSLEVALEKSDKVYVWEIISVE